MALVRAPEDAADAKFFMHENMVAGATNGEGQTVISADSDPLAGLQRAAGHWDNPPDSFLRTSIVSTTDTPISIDDGVNVIAIANTPAARAAVGGALAIARRVAFPSDGIIFDSDIVFTDVAVFGGNNIPFSTNVAENTFHLTSVASHEIGHTHGLAHSGVAGATMFARTGSATDLQETPKEDDLTFVRDIYGDGDVAARFGSIQGTVSIEGGGTANGVFVAAVDPSSGAVISTQTDFGNGTFDMGPIPPGNYYLSAEPVDGPAFTFDFPGVTGFELDVRDGFFGGNANPQAVNVTAGKGASNASFTIQPGAKTIDIRRLGIGPTTGGSFRHSTGPRELTPGETVNLYLWGPGVDDPAISNANVRIFGDTVTIRPGSVGIADSFGTFNDGSYEGMFVKLTVDVAASVQGIPLATIAVFKDGEAAVYTGSLVVKGEVDTGPQNPEFTSEGLTNSASFVAGDVSEEEIVTLFGLHLADFTEIGLPPLGNQRGGASVDITDSQGVTRSCLMYLASVGQSFDQLNFIVADATATGPATLTVRRASGGSHSIAINVVGAAPGVFTANASGSGFPAANILRFVDGVQTPAPPALPPVVSAAPIDLGPANHQVFLSLFLTGIRNGSSVQITINGVPMTTIFGPAASSEFDGLDQLNALIDRGLIGQGLVNVVVTIDGVVANIVQINLL